MENGEVVRRDIVGVKRDRKDFLVAALKQCERLTFREFLPTDDKCHFERYYFLHASGKLSVVYDTKAEIFSLSAKADVLTCAEAAIAATPPKAQEKTKPAATPPKAQEKTKPVAQPKAQEKQKPAATPSKAQEKTKPAAAQPKAQEKTKPAAQPKAQEKTKPAAAQPKAQEKTKPAAQPKAQEKTKPAATPPKAQEKTKPAAQPKAQEKTKPAVAQPKAQEKTKPAAAQPKAQEKQKPTPSSGKKVAAVHTAEQVAVPSSPLASAAPTEYKNGFSVKKCPQGQFDAILKRIRALKGVTVMRDEKSSDKGIVAYRICDKTKTSKCILRYVAAKQTVQLQGKWSNLFGEVQVILSSGAGFKDAVGSHMELTGEPKRASTVERNLRKLLPNAFDLLSEQSRINLGIGMIDIGNPEVKLSDYSVLLVPPYRGLERFIYDLQQARGIVVKMIGQAYEKDDEGHYLLKAAYRKRNEVVYAEVMSALYSEYFAQRNFYAHSDNTDSGQSRVISDKEAAKKIFDRLCMVIDYNAKKLKEIRFTISTEQKQEI